MAEENKGTQEETAAKVTDTTQTKEIKPVEKVKTKPELAAIDDIVEDKEILPASEQPDPEIVAFAKKILSKKKECDAVYIVDGLCFESKERAKGRSLSTKGKIYTVKRS
jgi:hypothetical protein